MRLEGYEFGFTYCYSFVSICHRSMCSYYYVDNHCQYIHLTKLDTGVIMVINNL